ncbi:major capsid protein E [Klebsiella pneumoniae]|uniref:major capsid protein E n=1 Tax=Klebsiella pneumoniae TaxID=573 RepID=UPI001C3C4268|nr:major capsid protein E [Klebsiella pneumoniae]MBK2887608.1 major capsid protein E [Klebsiella pneumoniae]MBV5433729.1 major capsid protein E [Klebsiella pneumoniae]HBV1819061.1 major capsid protein E [Klebsiella pneumoniae]HBV1824866.1 major capsid protein E [Klebsiella pneumoniae]HBX2620753.1 major capsid protein E [Klebsiella pneumoniae]
MAYTDIFSGNMYDFASPFTFSTQINQIISNLSLFKVEHHSVNSIALDKITDIKNLVAPEKMPYAHSDWNSASRPEYSSVLYQQKYTNSLNEVSSRDLEQYRQRGVMDQGDQIALAINDFSDAQYAQVSNTVEVDLVEALLGLRVQSQYAGQGDLDFLAGGSKTTYIMDISASANVFQQLSEIGRIQNVKLGSGLAQAKQGVVILASGKAAVALRYHPSVRDFMVYTLPLESGDNFYTRTKGANPAFETWTLNGVTVIDVTGYSLITDKIGVDSFVSLPVMSENSNAYVLHSGVGVRHATQGKDANLYHQYVTVDQRWGYPAVATECSYLPIVNIPEAIIFGSVTE